MQVVQESAEHHFLTLLEKMKTSATGWVGIHCAFSRRVDHDSLVSDLRTLGARLAQTKEDSRNFMAALSEKAKTFNDAIIYQFADSDLLLLARPVNDQDHEAFYALFKELSTQMKAGLIDFISFDREIMGAQKLADRKFLAKKRMVAYETMADSNRIASIGVRRARRNHALVLIVEDDRFTATYTSNILNKTYDLVHAKTGEEAVISYVENAPDIVFLDIHLPGLNGLETLYSIRQIDPEAHVVMLSVDTVKTNIVTSTNRGAAAFLKKPFSKERLLALVAKSPFIKGSKVTQG